MILFRSYLLYSFSFNACIHVHQLLKVSHCESGTIALHYQFVSACLYIRLISWCVQLLYLSISYHPNLALNRVSSLERLLVNIAMFITFDRVTFQLYHTSLYIC